MWLIISQAIDSFTSDLILFIFTVLEDRENTLHLYS